MHGWPQTWYAWRMLIPALARDFEVIAVDPRGIAPSDKPPDGYDTGTLTGDLVAVMDALGHTPPGVCGEVRRLLGSRPDSRRRHCPHLRDDKHPVIRADGRGHRALRPFLTCS